MSNREIINKHKVRSKLRAIVCGSHKPAVLPWSIFIQKFIETGSMAYAWKLKKLTSTVTFRFIL